MVWQSHQAAYRILKEGVTTAQLNEAYRSTFAQHDAESLFLNYGPIESPFPAETCISINEELVHGIPGPRKVANGDIVSLDTGCRVDNWCGDAAVTHAIGNVSDECKKLLKVTRETLDLAIELLAQKTMWSEIASEMQTFVEDSRLFRCD